jgi:hypothetical protein
MEHPKRRKTDNWNGRIKFVLNGALWLCVVCGWVYTLGVNGNRLDVMERAVVDLNARVEILQTIEATGAAETARLSEAIDNLRETVRELRTDLRVEQRRDDGG